MKKKLIRILTIPYTFTLMNWAVVAGLVCFARGHEAFWNAPRVSRPQDVGVRHS